MESKKQKKQSPRVKEPYLRHIKIHEKILTRGPKHTLYPDYISVPSIRFYGKWLAEAGFAIGETMQITVSNKTLVIEAGK